MAHLQPLPLQALHLELGAKMVPFAGWNMPVQYPSGVLAEHLHTRTSAGLFDVSHMAQIRLPLSADSALERLTPSDVLGLAPGHQTYGVLTTESGGIIDDFMLARREQDLFLVANAARREADLKHLACIKGVTEITDRALLALQGPLAEQALARLVPSVKTLRFLQVTQVSWQDTELWISRSGYTGEDGFEISVEGASAEALARALLEMNEVAPAGLGARDSLRLEAGMPLYGNDLSEEVSPIEAGLNWAIGKARRTGGPREGGFPGAHRILKELKETPGQRRIGLKPEKTPMRQGVMLFDSAAGGQAVGAVTSGGFSPSLECPIAMALVTTQLAPDAPLFGEVRGKRLPVERSALPFVPNRYRR